MNTSKKKIISLVGVCFLLIALLLGAGVVGYKAGRRCDEAEAAIPKESVSYTINVSSEQKQPTSAAYLAVAKSLIAIGDEGSAVPFLERAALLSGPEQKEATDLLAKSLAKRMADSPDNQKNVVAYSSNMTPQEVVLGYLSASTWQQRLPFVLNPKTAGPVMAIKYHNIQLKPEMYKTATFMPLEKTAYLEGETFTLTADMSKATPSVPSWKYVVVKTKAGYKVNWEASQSLHEAAQQEITMRALQLEYPAIEATILKSRQQYASKYSYIDLRLTNRSNKILGYFCVIGEAYDRNNSYLARGMTNGTTLKPGESRTESMSFEVDGVDMGSWKLSLENVSIETAGVGQGYGSNRIDVSRFFTLKMVSQNVVK